MSQQLFVQAGVLLLFAVGIWLLSERKNNAIKQSDMISFGLKGKSQTPTLDQYSTDFTALAREKKIDAVVGRAGEILRLTQVLSRRTKNNAILVGPPGVGKTAIVEGMADLIVRGEVPASLHEKRLLALDMTNLLSGTKYRGEFEQRAKKIVTEIQRANRSIILFVDEIHAIIQTSGTEGALNLADILKPALARGELQMIGATTHDEYEKYIRTDLSLERRFQPIEVHEPTPDETLDILQGVKDKFRVFHKVEFTDAALAAAVRLSHEKIRDRKLPDKAIDAIDEAAAMIKVSHLHEAVPGILFEAAAAKNPEAVKLWQAVQDLDKKIAALKTGKAKNVLIKKREIEEQSLALIGVVTVDSTDVEKVVTDWCS